MEHIKTISSSSSHIEHELVRIAWYVPPHFGFKCDNIMKTDPLLFINQFYCGERASPSTLLSTGSGMTLFTLNLYKRSIDHYLKHLLIEPRVTWI